MLFPHRNLRLGMKDASTKKQRPPAELESERPLTEVEAADLLGIRPRTLNALRKKRKGPAFLKAAGIGIRYLRKDIQAYLEQARRPNLPPLPPPSDER